MKRWRLFVVRAAEREEGSETYAANFEEADRIAKELFKKYDDGNYCDVQVWCVRHEEFYPNADFHPEEDFPVYSKDSFGDCSWSRMRVGNYGYLGLEYDEDFIDEIKEEDKAYKIRHIEELSEDELKDLFMNITPGSIYLSDYANDYGVDEKEVSSWVDGFDEDLVEQIKDEFPTITDRDLEETVEAKETADNFASYCLDRI